MEKLDLYDIHLNKLNKTIVRGEGMPGDDEYVLVTTIWIRSGIRYLIQHTSPEKGSIYASTGGCVSSGNTSREQIKIECKEELDFELKDENLSFLGRAYLDKAIFDIYYYEDEDIDLEEIKFNLQKEEVESVVWLTKDEIEDLIIKDEFRESSANQYMQFIRKM